MDKTNTKRTLVNLPRGLWLGLGNADEPRQRKSGRMVLVGSVCVRSVSIDGTSTNHSCGGCSSVCVVVTVVFVVVVVVVIVVSFGHVALMVAVAVVQRTRVFNIE